MATAAFAFLWLVSSSAWGKGLTDVKWATDPHYLVEICKDVCEPGEFPSMGRLNASVVSGDKSLDVVTQKNTLYVPSRRKGIGHKHLEAFLPYPVSSGNPVHYSDIQWQSTASAIWWSEWKLQGLFRLIEQQPFFYIS